MTIHKPQPKFGWHGEAEPIETYETRLQDPRKGRAYRVPDNQMEWLPDEDTQSQFNDAGKRIDVNERMPSQSQIIPDDLVAQLRGGPITSPWIERAKSILQETNARRAVAQGEPGSVQLGDNTVFVGPPLA